MLECKVLRANREQTIRDAVAQTAGYVDVLGAAAGHLVVFDRRKTPTWREKIFQRTETAPDGMSITVWGM